MTMAEAADLAASADWNGATRMFEATVGHRKYTGFSVEDLASSLHRGASTDPFAADPDPTLYEALRGGEGIATADSTMSTAVMDAMEPDEDYGHQQPYVAEGVVPIPANSTPRDTDQSSYLPPSVTARMALGETSTTSAMPTMPAAAAAPAGGAAPPSPDPDDLVATASRKDIEDILDASGVPYYPEEDEEGMRQLLRSSMESGTISPNFALQYLYNWPQDAR